MKVRKLVTIMAQRYCVLFVVLSSLACSNSDFDEMEFRRGGLCINDLVDEVVNGEEEIELPECERGETEYTQKDQVRLNFKPAHFAQEMFIASDPECEKGEWEEFKSTKLYELPQRNAKVAVYVKFRSTPTSKESPCLSDFIVHDTVAPEVKLIKAQGAPTMGFVKAQGTPTMGFINAQDVSTYDQDVPTHGVVNGQTKAQGEIEINNLSEQNIRFAIEDKTSKVNWSSIRCSVDGGAYEECRDTFQATDLNEGLHELQVEAVDNAGNKAVYKYNWRTDKTAPTIQLLDKPQELMATSTAQFKYSAQDAVSGVHTINCRQEGQKWQTCDPEQHTFKQLPSGKHTFELQAVDKSGNTSPVLSYVWKVDAQGPALKWIQKPNLYMAASIPSSFELEVLDDVVGVDKILCSVDEGSWQDCGKGALSLTPSKPDHYKMQGSFSAAPHQIKVKAVDKAGNETQLPPYTWNIDGSAPVVKFNSEKSVPFKTNSNLASVYFEATDEVAAVASGVDKILCAVDDQEFQDCRQGQLMISGLQDGQHTVFVKAVDRVGNESKVEPYSWWVDTSVPKVLIVERPDELTKNNTAQLKFEATDIQNNIVGYSCQLKRGNKVINKNNNCNTGVENYEDLADGVYEFSVQVWDEVDNFSDPAKATWIVDHQAPRLKWLHRPSLQTYLSHKERADFKIEVTDRPAGIEAILCGLKATNMRRCTNNFEFGFLKKGTHTAYVRLIDRAGNESPMYSYTWQVVEDAQAPRVEITSYPAATTRKLEAEFEFESEDNSGRIKAYTCTLYKNQKVVRSEARCLSPHKVEKLDAGAYKFVVKAQDHADHLSEPVSFEWRVDQSGPKISIQGPQEVFQYKVAEVKITAQDVSQFDLQSLNCYLTAPGRPIHNCRLDDAVRLPTDKLGPLSFYVELEDRAGNKSSNYHDIFVQRNFKNHTLDFTIEDSNAVDILFVLDNSQSMVKEHRHLSQKIEGFLRTIKGLNYHIGLTTTDMESTKKEGSRGTLKPLLRGSDDYFIARSQLEWFDAQDVLAKALTQVGTKGSNKERGVEAVLTMFERSEKKNSTDEIDIRVQEFLRPEAHAAVVLISDSNETPLSAQSSFLLRFVRERWPQKHFIWNSIIAMEGDDKCKGEGTGFGFAGAKKRGAKYAQLSEETGGAIGSICESNWTNLLHDIGQRVLGLVTERQLNCEPSDVDEKGRLLSIQRAGRAYDGEWKLDGKVLRFAEPLDNGQYSISYQCYTDVK